MGSKSGFAASGFFSHETYVVFLLNTPSTSLLTPPLQVVRRAPAQGSLHHTSNSQGCVLHMITYMFQCCVGSGFLMQKQESVGFLSVLVETLLPPAGLVFPPGT